MRKLVTLLAGVVLIVGMAAGSAFAVPTLPLGFGWVNTSFWTFTDFTTSNSDFEIRLENAGYESDFGLFNVDDINSPTAVTTKFEIFNYLDDPAAEATVKLRIVSGQLQIALAGVNKLD